MHTFKFQRSLSQDDGAAADKQQLLMNYFLFEVVDLTEGKQKGCNVFSISKTNQQVVITCAC